MKLEKSLVFGRPFLLSAIPSSGTVITQPKEITMKQFFTRLLLWNRTSKKATLAQKRKLQCEPLEDRLALSSFVNPEGHLYIYGSNRDDVVVVSTQLINHNLFYKVTENGESHLFAASRVKDV